MTTNATTIHKFEAAGLGKAPFRITGSREVTYQACHGAPIQPGGSCDYCGTAIVLQVFVRSADGKNFKVGCDCALKVGDAGLKKAVNKIKLEAKHKADAARITAVADSLSDPELREKLAAMPHPFNYAGQNLLDWVNWMLVNGGTAGKLKAVRTIEKVSK